MDRTESATGNTGNPKIKTSAGGYKRHVADRANTATMLHDPLVSALEGRLEKVIGVTAPVCRSPAVIVTIHRVNGPAPRAARNFPHTRDAAHRTRTGHPRRSRAGA